MSELFILVRKSGSKRFIGAIPTKKGATLAQAKKAKGKLKSGFSGRVVTRSQLLRIIKKQRPRVKRKRTVKKRA